MFLTASALRFRRERAKSLTRGLTLWRAYLDADSVEASEITGARWGRWRDAFCKRWGTSPGQVNAAIDRLTEIVYDTGNKLIGP